jgi:cellobiose-specific phosphotransferase system component IIB
MFNFAKRKKDNNKPQEKQLIDYNKENGFSSVENPPNLHGLIKETHENDDGQKILESKFERKNEEDKTTTEGQLNTRESYVVHRRSFDNNTNVTDINILSQSYDKKKEKAITEAEKEQNNNNDYWDKYVSEQMLFEKTSSPKNVNNNNGICNDKDRFDSIFDFDVDVNKSLDSYNKEMKISKMSQKDVNENLKTADAMIFKIYYDALRDKRKLSEKEDIQINRISSVKEMLISQTYEEMAKEISYLKEINILLKNKKSNI